MTPLYIFGRFGAPGHALLTSARYLVEVGEVPDTVIRGCDGLLHYYVPGMTQPEGERTELTDEAKARLAGWSYVSWWDRQGDPRTGSHTGILMPGRWTPAELVSAARARAPWAFRVPLGRWADAP